MEKRVHNTDDAKLAAPNAKALEVREGSHDCDKKRGRRSLCAIATSPPRIYSSTVPVCRYGDLGLTTSCFVLVLLFCVLMLSGVIRTCIGNKGVLLPGHYRNLKIRKCAFARATTPAQVPFTQPRQQLEEAGIASMSTGKTLSMFS